MTRATADRVGLAVFLASWAMLVAALGFAALALRPTSLATPALIAMVSISELAAISCVAAAAVSTFVLLGWTRLAVASAFVFAGIQVALIGSAILGGSSQGAHLLLLVGSFHALNVAVALCGFLGQLYRRRSLGLWGTFWHALAIAWLFFSGVLFL